MRYFNANSVAEYNQLKGDIDPSTFTIIKGTDEKSNILLLMNFPGNLPKGITLLGWGKATLYQIKMWLMSNSIQAQIDKNGLYVFGQLVIKYHERVSVLYGLTELTVDVNEFTKYGIAKFEINDLLEAEINRLLLTLQKGDTYVSIRK